MEEKEAVVVPLVPADSAMSTESMLRMLLNNEAVLISRVNGSEKFCSSGLIARSAGSFAKAMSQVTDQLQGVQKIQSANNLYRVVLPAGYTTRDLVSAVGGGYRGMVRAAGSSRIAAHARLVPASAVVGGGVAIAAGPLIATVGLAMVSDMLAQHQMNKKLETITDAVMSVKDQMEAQNRAVLNAAEKEIRIVSSYLLDQAEIPQIAGAGPVFANLEILYNMYAENLDRWSSIVKGKIKQSRVNGSELIADLCKDKSGSVQQFQGEVLQTYETFALQARVTLIQKLAAEFTNKNKSLTYVEKVLHNELAAISERQNQLVELIDDLSVLPIDSSRLPVAFAGRKEIDMRTDFARLARALHKVPEALPVLDDSEHTVFELEPNAQGLSFMTPNREQTASNAQ